MPRFCLLCQSYGCDSAEAEHRLTPRELTVLAGIARGWANKAIADELGITDSTVDVNVGSIYRKLPVPDQRANNRSAAMLWWIEHAELHKIAETLRASLAKKQAA